MGLNGYVDDFDRRTRAVAELFWAYRRERWDAAWARIFEALG